MLFHHQFLESPAAAADSRPLFFTCKAVLKQLVDSSKSFRCIAKDLRHSHLPLMPLTLRCVFWKLWEYTSNIIILYPIICFFSELFWNDFTIHAKCSAHLLRSGCCGLSRWFLQWGHRFEDCMKPVPKWLGTSWHHSWISQRHCWSNNSIYSTDIGKRIWKPVVHTMSGQKQLSAPLPGHLHPGPHFANVNLDDCCIGHCWTIAVLIDQTAVSFHEQSHF